MILKTALNSHLTDLKIETTAVLIPISFAVMMKTNHLVISKPYVLAHNLHSRMCNIFQLYFSFEMGFQLIHHKKINATKVIEIGRTLFK